MDTTRNSLMVKFGMTIKLVKILIGMVVTVAGQGPECHLTCVKGRLAVAE